MTDDNESESGEVMLSSASSEPDDAGDGTDNDYEYRNDAEAEGEYSASEEEGDADGEVEEEEQAPSAGAAAAEQQQEQQQPRGGLPSLPARPVRGMPQLPDRTRPAANGPEEPPAANGAAPAAEAAAATSTERPAAPAGMPSLPGRAAPPPAGGLPSLPPRPTAAAASSGPSLPARPAGLRGALPSRGGPPAAGGTAAPSAPVAAAATAAPPPPAQAAPPTAPPAAPVVQPAASAAPAGGLRPLAPRPSAAPSAAAAPPAPSGFRSGFLSGAPPAPQQPRAAAAATAPPPPPPQDVADRTDSRSNQQLQRALHQARVAFARAGEALGTPLADLAPPNPLMGYMALALGIENGVAGYKTKKPDSEALGASLAAARAAARAQQPLDYTLKVMLIGPTGGGKTELVNALLGREPGEGTSIDRVPATRGFPVATGLVGESPNGAALELRMIDTPGLQPASEQRDANAALLKRIAAQHRRHKPDLVIYVERLDAAETGSPEGRSSFESLFELMTKHLGPAVCGDMFILWTHAHAAMEQGQQGYSALLQKRRQLLATELTMGFVSRQQNLRTQAGQAVLLNRFHVADSHPDCPSNAEGKPIVYMTSGPQAMVPVPWKQRLLLQALSWGFLSRVVALLQQRIKAKQAAAAKQQAAMGGMAGLAGLMGGMGGMMPGMMGGPRIPRIPGLEGSQWLPNLTEGILQPGKRPVAFLDLSRGAELHLRSERDEDTYHAYWRALWREAQAGDPYAQREYAQRVRAYRLWRKSKARASEEAELEGGGPSQGLSDAWASKGTSFDPDMFRYRALVPVSALRMGGGFQLQPTRGTEVEHDSSFEGLYTKYKGHVLSRDGWGGHPLDLTCILQMGKDDGFLALTEARTTLVHSTPGASRSISSDVTASAEVKRPDFDCAVYQLEVNTFMDGLVQQGDRSGFGAWALRVSPNGNALKGDVISGFRLQGRYRAAGLQASSCGAVLKDTRTPRDTVWGGRTELRWMRAPGWALYLDGTAKQSPGEALATGWAAQLAHSFFCTPLRSKAVVSADYNPGAQAMHMEMRLKGSQSWRMLWLLVLPVANYVRSLLGMEGGGEGMEGLPMGEEEEEGGEAEGAAGGGAGMAAMMQQMAAMGLTPPAGMAAQLAGARGAAAPKAAAPKPGGGAAAAAAAQGFPGMPPELAAQMAEADAALEKNRAEAPERLRELAELRRAVKLGVKGAEGPEEEEEEEEDDEEDLLLAAMAEDDIISISSGGEEEQEEPEAAAEAGEEEEKEEGQEEEEEGQEEEEEDVEKEED